MTVAIKFDTYELANLLKALEMTPSTGDWHAQMVGLISEALRERGYYIPSSKLGMYANLALDEIRKKEGLIPFTYDANPMTTDDIRRHLDYKDKNTKEN